MAQITIDSLTEIGSADPNDFLVIWDSSVGATRKIKVSNLLASGGGGAISSGVPVVLRGTLGEENLVRNGILRAFTGVVSGYMPEHTYTIASENMFSLNSVVTGNLDGDITLTKVAGETHIFVNSTAISVGGGEITFQHPSQEVQFGMSGKTRNNSPLTMKLQCSEDALTIKTKGYLNYNLQVYA